MGKNAADANARRLRKEAELNAVNNGVAVCRRARTATDHSQQRSPISSTKRSSRKSPRPRRVYDGADLLHGVLPQAVPGRHRTPGPAEVLRLPARRERAGTTQLLQQVRKRDDIPKAHRDSRARQEERLAALHRRGTEIYEQEELDKLFEAVRRGRAALVRVLPDDRHARAGSDAHLLVGCELLRVHGARQSQARPRVDPEGYKEREIPIPAKLAEEAESVEGEVRQKHVRWCSLLLDASRSSISSTA